MKIRFLQDEDIVNYKKTSMVIGMPYCDGKCWKKLNEESPGKYDWSLCQNSPLLEEKIHEISQIDLIKRYLNNPLTHAIIFAGMEPLLSMSDIVSFIMLLREVFQCEDDVVVYTGYDEDSLPVENFITQVRGHEFGNIIMKFGRYIPDQTEHFDEVLGVKLISDNQYAKKIC